MGGTIFGTIERVYDGWTCCTGYDGGFVANVEFPAVFDKEFLEMRRKATRSVQLYIFLSFHRVRVPRSKFKSERRLPHSN